MNRKRLLTWLATCLCLSSCAGYNEAVEISDEYTGTRVVSYSNSSGLWRISDRPEAGRLVISPSLARQFGAAFGPDVTFVPPTRGETLLSVQGWLASVGRNCIVTDSRLLVSPQWEFMYSCG